MVSEEMLDIRDEYNVNNTAAQGISRHIFLMGIVFKVKSVLVRVIF
jgi:hypothetical protein